MALVKFNQMSGEGVKMSSEAQKNFTYTDYIKCELLAEVLHVVHKVYFVNSRGQQARQWQAGEGFRG